MRRLLLLVLAASLLTGCASMPTSGPVTEIGKVVAPAEDEGFAIDPRPPQPGASPTDIVLGFLDAMQATPIQTTVARQFLAHDLASSWNPQLETITYADKTLPHGSGVVSVDLQGANHLDAQGAWQGPISTAEGQLRFPMVRERGQWRIAAAPNALIVPQSWFDSRFTQVSLYFFDPTGRILVPEPVFVPRGTQLATTLVRDLVTGPSKALTGVARTFLPAGVSSGLSVPVGSDGVAAVDLNGELGQQSAHTLQLMTAQLAWTLRQDQAITALRLSIGGRPVDSGGGATDISASGDDEYDPAGSPTTDRLYGLDKGLVVVRSGSNWAAVAGPLGETEHPLRSVAVALDETQAAAVSADGRQLLLAPLAGGGKLRVALTGQNLLRPAWDFDSRLWEIDRTAAGAVVSVVEGTRVATVDVPGITGQDVRRFLVSRDGSRLVAVVRRPRGDEVVASRLQGDDQGRVTGATPARIISDPSEGSVRIKDLGWESPTAVLALQQLSGTALIHTLSVDGAVAGYPGATLTVGDRLKAMVTSPVPGNALYGVAGTDLITLSGESRDTAIGAGLTALGYVG